MTITYPDLAAKLGDLAGRAVDPSNLVVNLYGNDHIAEYSAPWREHDIGDGRMLTDHYHLLGADCGGDKFIIARDWTGPVLLFGHESTFDTTQVADSLAGFVAICKTLFALVDDLDEANIGDPGYFKAVLKLMKVVAKHNGGTIPRFWSGSFLPN
jgi:hypothetical protein